MPSRSVVLLSGGLDSSANLAFCKERDEPILALTALYGQRAQEREARAAEQLARHYGVPHRIVDLRWLGAMGGSSLTDSSQAVPELETSKLDHMETIRETAKSVWVPNRNGVLINVAAAFAEKEGAEQVIVGFNSEEAATFPDNSNEYMTAVSVALGYSTANGVRVHSYTVKWDKTRIVQELRQLASPFPFEKLWSCYLGGETPCGRCESCQRLARALKAASV